MLRAPPARPIASAILQTGRTTALARPCGACLLRTATLATAPMQTGALAQIPMPAARGWMAGPMPKLVEPALTLTAALERMRLTALGSRRPIALAPQLRLGPPTAKPIRAALLVTPGMSD